MKLEFVAIIMTDVVALLLTILLFRTLTNLVIIVDLSYFFYSIENCDIWNNTEQSNYNGTHLNGAILFDNIHVDPEFIDDINYGVQSTSPYRTASSEGGQIGAYGNGGNPLQF